ncbi:MAG: hypothetical protein R3C10_15395 [Pirellulales bacterium]
MSSPPFPAVPPAEAARSHWSSRDRLPHLRQNGALLHFARDARIGRVWVFQFSAFKSLLCLALQRAFFVGLTLARNVHFVRGRLNTPSIADGNEEIAVSSPKAFACHRRKLDVPHT